LLKYKASPLLSLGEVEEEVQIYFQCCLTVKYVSGSINDITFKRKTYNVSWSLVRLQG